MTKAKWATSCIKTRWLEQGQLHIQTWRKRVTNWKITPISNVLGFITAIANMHVLAKVLFSTTSPLMIGLHELQKIVLLSKQEGKLQCISNFHLNYFAYAMWGIYKCCNNFFKMHLSWQDLLEGTHLQNPFKDFNYEMACWQEITRARVLASLGYLTSFTKTSSEPSKTLSKNKHKTIEEEEEEEIVKKKKGNDKSKWKPMFWW